MVITTEQRQTKIGELVTLATLPSVVQTISTMVEDKNVSAGDIAKAISKDQALCTKILRLVNSPLYGFPGRISSVTHALVLLGFTVVKGLILSTAVFDTLGRHMEGLWEHSLGCAILSRRLAREAKTADPEEGMIVGLLHDLGKGILSFMVPLEFGEVVGLAKARKCHIAETEQEVFGTDHARVGSWMATQWHLPPRLVTPLAYHHSPSASKAHQDVAAVVHLADILARGLGYGSPGDAAMPQLDHEAFTSLALTFAQIESVIEGAEVEYNASVDVFHVGD